MVISIRSTATALMALALGASAEAQQASPYAGQQHRETKALAAEEIDALLGGAGMGFAKAAELNAYPGPRHVLELSEELAITAEQRAATQKIFERMQGAAKDLGSPIVALERQLDSVFASGGAAGATVDSLVDEIATLLGRLRATHLRAHIEMRETLRPEQITVYARLRGYAEHKHEY